MTINIFKTVNELRIGMADYFVTIEQNTIASRGEFNIVLSGGSSPALLYDMLSSQMFTGSQ
jgi:6-phosphogluconolactonase